MRGIAAMKALRFGFEVAALRAAADRFQPSAAVSRLT
jgi:hypothetical protein